MPKNDSDEGPRRARKTMRKRRKREHVSSCSCSTDPSSSDSKCCCCSSPSLSCSSSDSDERFARYYKLSSDEFELRGVDFPVESKKKRREMTKLLLHTMVMWDDIWKSRVSDKDSTTYDEGSSSSSEDEDLRRMNKPRRGDRRYKNKTNSLQDLTISKRLKQTLGLKQEHGVFFSGKWYGLPIEEIDPFIYDDTFVVLSWRPKGPCLVQRYFKGDSLGLFAPDHPVRTFAFKVVTHRYFTRVLQIAIFANCITLALEKYEYDEYGKRFDSDLDTAIAIFEMIFLVLYSIEMMLKIIAKGFLFQRMAYLRNGWNILDFVVVVTNYLSYSLELAYTNQFDLDFEGTDFEFLRIFRVLRIVKTISILPGLRRIVTAILNSSKQLFEVMGLTVFTVMIFSLIGMEFFAGSFRRKCVKIKGALIEGFLPEVQGVTEGLSSFMTDRLYGMWVENEHNWLYRDKPDSEPVPCSNGTYVRKCPVGYVCLELANTPSGYNHGWMSFDNFFLAALQTLQVMTLDYWERIYELALSTVGWEGTLYFVIVIFFGGFYLLNLMLAVVTLSYEKEQNLLDVNKKNPNLTVPRRLALTRKMSSFYFEHLNQQRLHLFEGFHEKSARERDELLLRMIKADEFAHPKSGLQFESSQQVSHAFYNMLGKVGRYEQVIKRSSAIDLKAITDLNIHRKPIPDDGYYDEFYLFDGQSDSELVNEKDPNCIKLKNGKICNYNLVGFDQTFTIPEMSKFVKRPIKDIQFELFPSQEKMGTLIVWLGVWRNATQPIVEDWKWKNLMILCIFINTVISCLEHHEQQPWMDHLIHLSNDTFTYVFTVELLLKAIAYQNRFFEYGWNKFDLWVVVGSILDNILQAQVGYKGLRGLKLLRILKLAQAWDTMKVLLNILFSAIGDMANLVGILFFVIYIFAMFGMQYIGGGYHLKEFNADYYPANYPRWAWQTAFHSFLMVFRVVSGEWVELTWECLACYRARRQEYKCFQTFLPMTVLGNFIVLNLFLALLLHIFDADEINSLSKSVKADRRERGNTFRGNIKRIWRTLTAKCSKSGEGKGKGRIKLSFKRNKVKPEIITDSKESPKGSKVNLEVTPDEEAGTVPPVEGQGGTAETPSKSGIVPTPEVIESKSFKIIIPRKQPKWRLYKVVTKYVEVGDHNDTDVDDELLDQPKQHSKRKGKKGKHVTEVLDIETLSNLRFRRAVYSVILLIRKEKARRMLQRYCVIKERQKRLAFLAAIPSRASKLSTKSKAVVEPDIVNSDDDIDVHPCCHTSWYQTAWCLPCWISSRCRLKCLEKCRGKVLIFVNHEYFEWSILFLIIASSITLCFDDVHLEDSATTKDFLFYSGLVFTSLFFLEFLLKIFAKGIYAYFTSAWSVLDFFALVISSFTCVTEVATRLHLRTGKGAHTIVMHMGSLKTLRTLRCIRPLRTISRWHGMRIVVNSLLQAIPAIFNVFCVCLVFWLVFAIMGVQFFKGRFFKCVNHLGETVDHTIAPNKLVCCQKTVSHKFSWTNSFPNFDSVPEAYLALLYLATFEGWMDVIRFGIDARDIDQQPMRDYDIYAYIFFMIFCLFGGFLTTKLFIGVIIDNFNMLKKKFEGNLYEALMSPNQLKYFSAIKKLGRKRIRYVLAKPKNPTRLAFFEIAISQRSEFFMFIIVVFNMVVMCCDGYGNQIAVDTVLESFNAFFIFIYTLEAAVKIIGLGRAYFKSGWNVFDIVILAISACDYAIGDLLSRNFPIPTSVVRICRILRVGRVMRLMKSAKGIRRLVFALFVSIPALFNVAALLILVMFIYSILGMSLFGRAGYGGAFDELINFETFPKAFLLLFRLITVAGWNDVLGTLLPMDVYCGPPEDECGGEGQPDCEDINPIASIIFVVTYLIITNFVIVNMYIAIILENFDQAVKEDDYEVTGDDIELFLDKWAVFDGEGTQFMELKYLPPFLDILEEPLRMSYPNQIAITALDIPIYQGGLIQIYDVMRNLVVFVMGNAEASQMEEIQKIINGRFANNFRQKRILPLVSTTRIWKVQHNAATCIQRHWRKYLRRHNRQPNPPVEVMFNMETNRRSKGISNIRKKS